MVDDVGRVSVDGLGTRSAVPRHVADARRMREAEVGRHRRRRRLRVAAGVFVLVALLAGLLVAPIW
jgi:hypothetical protein